MAEILTKPAHGLVKGYFCFIAGHVPDKVVSHQMASPGGPAVDPYACQKGAIARLRMVVDSHISEGMVVERLRFEGLVDFKGFCSQDGLLDLPEVLGLFQSPLEIRMGARRTGLQAQGFEVWKPVAEVRPVCLVFVSDEDADVAVGFRHGGAQEPGIEAEGEEQRADKRVDGHANSSDA